MTNSYKLNYSIPIQIIGKGDNMKQILCFGDSNTYGLIPAANDRYPWGIRWTSILDENIKKYNYRVVEEGLCGRTTIFDDPLRVGRNGSKLISVLLETHRPVDIVVIMLGTNDCKAVYDANARVIGKGIERILDSTYNINKDSKVLIVSPIRLGDGVWEDGFDPEFDEKSVETSKKLEEVYREVAKKRNTYFLAASDYADPSAEDREHMDEAGHKAFAEAITEKIKEIIDDI